MTDPTSVLSEGLRGSYVLDRPIGEGGMATVYLAQDLKHQRPVALKVLKPELAQNLGPERFRREITTAARLQHPHILSVHDSGETQGQFWFTMPFVDGESLRDRIRREGQLPVDEALRIARESAQALQYAHDRGIVHRDIKPENILLTEDGSTLVADFGIARALGTATDDTTQLTQTGTSIGTPTYMAPEQATGDKTVDARADQYSLAATLYEMLAGEPPFTATTAAALIAKRFTSTAPSVREKRPEVPAHVDQALQKALGLRADERFGSIQEFSRAVTASTVSSAEVPATTVSMLDVPAVKPVRRLSPALIGGALLAMVGIGALLLRRGTVTGENAPANAAAPAADVRSLAVLPFENLGDTADAYFADGIADELRGKLTALPGLQVIARSSSVQYRGTTKSPQDIAKELGVRYLLTGTVRWEKAGGGKGRVRVSPELIEIAPNGLPASKWQQPFDAPITDVFTVQTGIAAQVASALDVALGSSTQQALAQRPTRDLLAYDAYLRAEAAWQGGSDNTAIAIRRAEALYLDAVRRDSTFALAWNRLAVLHALVYTNLTPSPEIAALAREALQRAERLSPNDPQTVRAASAYESIVAGNPSRARTLLEEGLKRAPNNPDLIRALGNVERETGDFVAARRTLEVALRLDPRSPAQTSSLADTHLWLREIPDARTLAERAYALSPNPATLHTLMMVEVGDGNLARAREVLRDGVARYGRSLVTSYSALFWDLYWVLPPDDQRHVLSLRPDDGAFDGVRSSWALTLAQLHYLLGDSTQARSYADTARAEYVKEMRASPDDPQRNTLYGLSLALLGRHDEALAAGERGVQLSRGGSYTTGTYLEHQVARIHLILGEKDKALDILEKLLKRPYYLSPGWLRIDPTLAPLRGNPRFEKLIAGG